MATMMASSAYPTMGIMSGTRSTGITKVSGQQSHPNSHANWKQGVCRKATDQAHHIWNQAECVSQASNPVPCGPPNTRRAPRRPQQDESTQHRQRCLPPHAPTWQRLQVLVSPCDAIQTMSDLLSRAPNLQGPIPAHPEGLRSPVACSTMTLTSGQIGPGGQPGVVVVQPFHLYQGLGARTPSYTRRLCSGGTIESAVPSTTRRASPVSSLSPSTG